jgi:hypothetical protein
MIVRNLKIIIPQTVWQIPADPFVEYEPSDSLWARPLGFGQLVPQPITIDIPLAKYDAESNTFTAMIDEQPCFEVLT